MAKGKRTSVSVDVKLQALDEVDKKIKSKAEIAKEYGVPASTLSTWIKNSQSLRQSRDIIDSSRKRRRKAKHVDIDAALVTWCRQARDQNIPLSGPLIRAKARDLANELGIVDFQCSDGWLFRFKQRHKISFRPESACKPDTVVVKEDPDKWTEAIYRASQSRLIFCMAAQVLCRVMRAVRVHRFGGPEVLMLEKDVAIPEPKETQVLISGRAAGVNPVDTYIRSGCYGNLPSLPYTPGKDGSGIVAKVGSKVKRFKEGDRVYCVFSASGSYSQYHVTEEKYVFRLHDSLDYWQGAALGIPYSTAYRALVIRCKAKAGQTALIHGASGAVGLACCQIGQALGLNVIGTAGTKQGLDLIRKNGAESAFCHREEDYIDKIKQAVGEVDLIVEMLADVNLAVDCSLCKQHGKIAVVGSRGSLDFSPRLLMSKEIQVYGVALQTSSEDDLRRTEAYLYQSQKLGFIKPVIDKVLPLEDCVKAHCDVIDHTGGSHGKIVLDIN